MMISNENITSKKVRLVENGNTFIIETHEALRRAYEKNLDLVQVNSIESDIPVVKIMDLNKFIYEQKKTQKENEKKQRQNTPKIKEIRFSTDTDNNDLNSKFKNIQGFLENGDYVKIVVKVTGRINTQDAIENFVSQVNSTLKERLSIDHTEEYSIQKNKIIYMLKPVK